MSIPISQSAAYQQPFYEVLKGFAISHVIMSDDTCRGYPHLAGTRICVTDILDALRETKSFEGVRRYFKYQLTNKDIARCLAYVSLVIGRADLLDLGPKACLSIEHNSPNGCDNPDCFKFST